MTASWYAECFYFGIMLTFALENKQNIHKYEFRIR
jgi:hypothetical protein